MNKFQSDDRVLWNCPNTGLMEGPYIYRGPDYRFSPGKCIIYNPKSGFQCSAYEDHLVLDSKPEEE